MSLMSHAIALIKHNTNIYAPGGFRTHNPSKRTAEDLRPRQHGHWDRRIQTPDRPARSVVAIPTTLFPLLLLSNTINIYIYISIYINTIKTTRYFAI
jgi:hypothetical protein